MGNNIEVYTNCLQTFVLLRFEIRKTKTKIGEIVLWG